MPDGSAAASGHRRIDLDTVDSTNEDAFRRLAAGEATPLWITARRQSAGRGRSGRPWVSPVGNLHVSLALRVDLAPEARAKVGFVAGLALVEALEQVSDARFRLKWPNDVLVDGAKIAGLLLEARSADAIVIGWGVNVASAPTGTETPATSLSALGAEPAFETIVAELIRSFEGWWALFDHGAGFHDLRRAWLDWAHGVGGPIRVRQMSGERHGTFEGLDAEGRLVLRDADGGMTLVSAGDVFF